MILFVACFLFHSFFLPLFLFILSNVSFNNFINQGNRLVCFLHIQFVLLNLLILSEESLVLRFICFGDGLGIFFLDNACFQRFGIQSVLYLWDSSHNYSRVPFPSEASAQFYHSLISLINVDSVTLSFPSVLRIRDKTSLESCNGKSQPPHQCAETWAQALPWAYIILSINIFI